MTRRRQGARRGHRHQCLIPGPEKTDNPTATARLNTMVVVEFREG